MRNTDQFSTRFSTMGDIAEGAYEEFTDQPVARFGFNRPDPSMAKWDAFIRYTPDYIHHDRFVEVKGCGRDGIMKLKQENLSALREWSDHLPVWLFVWNSHKQQSVFFEIDDRFMKWIGQHCGHSRFPDNNKIYWEVPFDQMVEAPWIAKS